MSNRPLSPSFSIKNSDISLPDLCKNVVAINSAQMWINPFMNKDLGTTAPPAEFLMDGLLAYADGTNWNPGSGKGYYRYNTTGATWVFVG
jgi:hypothetical protein